MAVTLWTVGLAAMLQNASGTGAPTQQPPAIAAIVACRDIADDAERLRCFDRSVSSLSDAAKAGSLVVVDREDVRRTRRSLFGFTLPKLPFFRGDTSQEETPDEVKAKVKSARGTGYNKWVVELDTGAVWQTTEPETRQFLPKPGADVLLKKGMLGSYTLSVNGNRGIKAMRIR